MVQKPWKLAIPLLVLSLCGAYISILLLDKHLLRSHGPTWFATVCGDEPSAPHADTSAPPSDSAASSVERNGLAEEVSDDASRGGADCDAVLASRWATIPPRPELDDELLADPGAQAIQVRIPAAYLGFVYFISLAIWFLFVGRPTPDRPEWYRIPLAFVICGVGSSLFFVYIMFTRTEEWCPWCMVTHIINFLVLIGMVLLRPPKLEPAVAALDAAVGPAPREVPTRPSGLNGEADLDDDADAATEAVELLARNEVAAPAGGGSPPARSHPSFRLAVVCILLSAATGAMVWNGYGVQVEQQQKSLVQAELRRFQEDVQFLGTIYERSPKVKIPIRPDDPVVKKEDDVLLHLVVFSDFQCPFCRVFAALVEQRLQKYFFGRLHVVWKHFPLSTDCNKTIKRNTHPQSCAAALAAEAARMQGGNEAFWKAHDALFKAQRKLKGFDYKALAENLELDPIQFQADMESQAARARIAEDITLARSLGVNSTPAVFLNGRRVEGKLVRVMPFWQAMATRFSQLRDRKIHQRKEKQRRARETKAAATQPVTPSTPNRRDAQ